MIVLFIFAFKSRLIGASLSSAHLQSVVTKCDHIDALDIRLPPASERPLVVSLGIALARLQHQKIKMLRSDTTFISIY